MLSARFRFPGSAALLLGLALLCAPPGPCVRDAAAAAASGTRQEQADGEKPWGEVTLVPWDGVEEAAPGKAGNQESAQGAAASQPPFRRPAAGPAAAGPDHGQDQGRAAATADGAAQPGREEAGGWDPLQGVNSFFSGLWESLTGGKTQAPGLEQELRAKGNALVLENRFQEALDIYATALQTYPDEPATLNNIGVVLRHMGKEDQALESYQFCLRVDPDYPLCYKNMAILYDRRGNYRAALEAYRAYARLRPRAGDAAVTRERIAWLEEMLRDGKKGATGPRPGEGRP